MRIKKRKQMRILWITRINAAAISAGELQEFMQLSIFVAGRQRERVTDSLRRCVPSNCDTFKKHACIIGGSLVAVPVPAWRFTVQPT